MQKGRDMQASLAGPGLNEEQKSQSEELNFETLTILLLPSFPSNHLFVRDRTQQGVYYSKL